MGPVQGWLLSDLLTIEGLTVRYGAATVLDRLDLTVGRGELFVLLGGSGSGKTTLLRAIGGFVRPDAGRIILNGQDISALPPHRRPVNTMFQSYALFPHMSVAENVAFGLRRTGWRADGQGRAAAEEDSATRSWPGIAHRDLRTIGGRRRSSVMDGPDPAPRDAGPDNGGYGDDRVQPGGDRDAERRGMSGLPVPTTSQTGSFLNLKQRTRARTDRAMRVADMLALVRLDGYGDRRPHQLSGGQQQRVALARSLAPNPALLLLDEPLSALDRALRGETRAELVRLQKRLGTTFILVTHDQEEALTMADRLAVMRDGRMLQIGTPAEVYEHPNSRFVAEFLGAANILPGVLGADGIELTGLGTKVPVPRASFPHGPVLLGLRPERLRLGPGVTELTGDVTEAAYGGESITWTIRLGNGVALRVSQSLRDGLGAARARIGEAVTVSWPPDACMVLPA